MSHQQDHTPWGRKILKTLGIILACLFGLVLLATLLLLTVLEPYAEHFLKEQVTEKTNGLYKLEFEDLDINLLTTTVTFKELHLYTDSSVHQQQKQQNKASAYLFELKTPLLEISHIGLMDALLNKQLDVSTVLVEKPHIDVLHDQNVSAESNKNAESSSSKGIGLLKSFQIEEIDIPDATLRHLVLDDQLVVRQVIPELSLRVLDFTIDSLEQASYRRPFKAEDIQLKLENYRYVSPDSVYTLKVDELFYSTKKEELLAKALRLIPDPEANLGLGPDKANRSIYEVKAPLLKISGLDLIEAYRTKELVAENLVLQGALVEILEDKEIPAATEFPELSDLYSNVSPFLTKVALEKLQIDDGALIYRTRIGEIFVIHELENTDLSLLELKLDSAVLFSPDENFYAEDLLLATRGYTYQHPHSPYTIKVPSLTLSTIGNYLQADSVQIIGDWEKNEALKQIDKAHYMLYSLFVPELQLSELDLVEALKTKRLDVDKLAIKDPELVLLRDKEVEKAAYGNWLQDTYREISGFVEELRIADIVFDDASFAQFTAAPGQASPELVQKLDEASLLASGLQLDSSFIFLSEARLPLQELKLRARDYTYWLPDDIHTFHLNTLAYSTRSEVLTARSFELFPQDSTASGTTSDRYKLEAPLLKITDLDLIKAINTRKLAVDKVILREPEVALYLDEQKADSSSKRQSDPLEDVFGLVEIIDINEIKLEDGTFVLRQKTGEVERKQYLGDVSASFSGIHLSADMLGSLKDSLPLEKISFTASNYLYRSPNGIYTITLDSLAYASQENQLTARFFDVDANLQAHDSLKTAQLSEASRNIFDVSARRFLVTGLNLLHAYKTGNFLIDEMLLVEPEVVVIQDQNVPEQQESETPKAADDGPGTREQVARVVDIFRVENLRVKDGTFKVSVLKDTIRRSQLIRMVSVYIEQLRLASLQASDPLEMFQVDELEVLVRDYTYLLPDSLYRLEVETLRTSLRQETLTIENIRLIPLYDVDSFNAKIEYEKDRFEVTVPQVRMLGMDLATLYNQQALLVDKILVLNPELNIYRDKQKPMNPQRRPGTLQDFLLEAGIPITADTVKVLSGRITYSEVPEKGSEPGVVVMADTYITLSNVTNDSALIALNPVVVAQASTEFMEASTLKVLFKFYLNHPEDYHTYEGVLEPMDFEAFNPLFTRLMFMRIESGFIDKALFEVEATEHQAVGNMRFLYENLEVQLLDKDDLQDPGFLQNAGTWVLNTLVVKSNNPSRLGNYRKGPINTERDYQKSIFNQMSTSMLDGMASSIMPNWVETIIGWFTDFP